MVNSRWRYHCFQREKSRQGLLSSVHLHLSVRCEHGLHCRLGLESVHVDTLFNTVHPRAMLEEVVEGKMNSNQRSKIIIIIIHGATIDSQHKHRKHDEG